MDILSSSSTLPSTSISISDMTDAVTSLPFDKIGNAAPDLDDVGDLAVAVVKGGGRIGLRTVRTSVRVVRRNPRLATGALASLIVVAALAIFLKKRSETTEVSAAS